MERLKNGKIKGVLTMGDLIKKPKQTENEKKLRELKERRDKEIERYIYRQ